MVWFLLLLLGLGTQAIPDGGVNMSLPTFEVSETVKGHIQCHLVGIPCVLLYGAGYVNGSDNEHCNLMANLVENPQKVFTIFLSFLDKVSLSFSLLLCEYVLPHVFSLYTPTADQENLRRLLYITDSCEDFFLYNSAAKESFLHVEKKLIQNVMELSRDKVPVTFRLKKMSVSVLNFNNSIISCDGPGCSIPLDLPQLLPQNASFIPSIQLPMSGLSTIPEKDRFIGLVSYKAQKEFQFEQDDIRSMVIKIELLKGYYLQNLYEPINMTFPLLQNNNTNVSDARCQFLNEKVWKWKSDGCETSIINESTIHCSCNHATPFAVLLIRQPIERVHWDILSYLTYIGCGLSAFFTSLGLLLFTFRRKHRKDHSLSIHVSLSGTLLLLNTTFLLTEWGTTVEPVWVCVFIAALMHYSLLCCFTWMALEALHLYLLLVKVFNTHYKYYMVKLSLVGWGIPAVIVGVFLGVQEFKQFYGVTEMTFPDSNQTSAMCWIKDQTFFYSVNLVYFTLIFTFNTGILMTVTCSIFKIKRAPKPALKTEAGKKTLKLPAMVTAPCRNGLTVLGLTCLLGTTWGLAFLGSGYVNYAILYLFCILNSSQGFFIFLWIVLSIKKQDRRKRDEMMNSHPVKTTTTKLA